MEYKDDLMLEKDPWFRAAIDEILEGIDIKAIDLKADTEKKDDKEAA